jgi:hypothetical protein
METIVKIAILVEDDLDKAQGALQEALNLLSETDRLKVLAYLESEEE